MNKNTDMQTIVKLTARNHRAVSSHHSNHHPTRFGQHLLLALLLMTTAGITGAWGQTDFSGTYYIGSVTYNAGEPADNFYLCPTVGYKFYDSNNQTHTDDNNGQPFITTYKCRGTDGYDPKEAVWIIEKHPTLDYYYIKHASDNKFLTYNPSFFSGNVGRVRVHLEASHDNDDNAALFAIEYILSTSSYDIKSKKAIDNSETRIFLNVNKGNKQSLKGDGDPFNNVNTGGIIGLWTAGSTEPQGSGRFYLEEAQCSTPIISYDSSTGEVTITSKTEGATIYYTTDGTTDPDSSSSQYNPENKPTISGTTTIKAIAVKESLINSEVATIKIVINPTITLTIPDGGFIYDKTEKEPEVSLKNGETPISSVEYEVSYSDNINAGTATVTISDAEGGDYIVSGFTTFTIASKALTVTADAKTKGYGDSDPELTYTATELVEGDVLEGTLSRAEGENLGTYAISQGTLANSNYSITFTSADLTIIPKSLGSGGEPAENITINVNNDGNNYVVTVKQGENTLTQGTDYTWTGSGNEFEYTVTVTGIGNYSGSAQATYIAATPGYYVLHQNGKGYLKVSGAGVNLANDGTFQSGNLFDKGNCIWYMTPQGYLQNEYFYLNVANNKTLYLSVNPVTRWRSEDVTGENTYGKKHLKINSGTEDLYLCNDGNSITLKASPSAYYSACPVDVEEVENSWAGPTADNLTVQSPQLVTYLRAYFTQKIKYNFHNDAGAEVKSTDGKHERRVYATIAYKEGGDGKETNWDIDESGILYNKKASGDVEFTATYNILPADPVVRAVHSTPAAKSIKYKVTQKPLAITADTDYLLYSISGGDNYRYPYDDGVTEGNPVKPDGKGGTGDTSVLTDPGTDKNFQISWKITVDAEGFYTFQNSSSSKYLYFDEAAHTSSDYGVLRLGDAPTGNSAKFRLYKPDNDANYGVCYYIIPYSKLFAVYKSDGIADGLYAALNNKDYTNGEPKVISLFKPNGNSTWCIYKYEAEYRTQEDFFIEGPSTADAGGNYEFTSKGWYGKCIKDSPKTGSAQKGLVIKGTYKNESNIDYQWTVTGLGNYINITDGSNTDGTWTTTTNGDTNSRKLVVNVSSLPVSTTSGVITLKLSGYSAPNTNVITSSKKTFAFTIFGDGTISFAEITSLAGITSSSGAYRLVGGEDSNFAYSDSNKPGITTFSGILDGNNQTISGLTAPLFDNLANGTVHNVNLSGVSISSHTGPTGAIAGTADGGSRIYNVGILGGEVGSSDNVCGGLVGKLDGSARVINCFSYATITGGTTVGGIVGNNTYATKSNDMRTMVMNCMFYGDITGGTSKAPIYNGQIITNRSDENGVGNFNYFWAGASYVQKRSIDVYNCALSAETRFLQRFEFFRHLLNSNRELAAWWATGSRDNKDKMMKWVLEPSQIGSSTPYPILKTPGQYPSVVNIDADHAEEFSGDVATKKTQYNQGRKFGTLTINIQNASSGNGSTAPSGANITTTTVYPNITDKDPAHFNFNYYKVQLPYYNDVGTGNYTYNKVVTGWKIVTISGGTHSFSTGSDATATADEEGNITLTTPYNFADRKSTEKDLFSVSGRVFSQGAYFDVPEGVSSITIEPYWGKCVYISDQYPDVVYNQNMSTAANVTTVGGGERYKNNNAYNINGSSQIVYTKYDGNDGAVIALDPSGTVYDNAIVLVGNVHKLDLSDKTNNKPYTIMSIDLDKDNEPDYSYILRFNSRLRVHPVRIDFLNVIGLGMAQKSTGGTGTYNFGIMQPFGWFECTNTGLFRVTQLEYDYGGQNGNAPRLDSPMILQGGVIEQWVTVGGKEATHTEAKSVTYYHVGGNVWFKEFHIGVHQDKTQDQFVSPHPPISVTGGDYDIFYLTGNYNTPNNGYDDNAECYINGGRFNKVAGTGMQGIGDPTNNTNGNITWQIDNADINEFYGGGINAAHIAQGNIMTVISNSRVDQFCGGPKFGDMNSDKKVVTNATNCTFRTFFGAGYGGNSYNRRYPDNQNNKMNINWNTWLTGNASYDYSYDSNYNGVETRIDYQFLPMSSNVDNVCRLFVDYVSFSLATTSDVTSKLTDCTITTSPLGTLDLHDGCLGNFYGGGSLGKVEGPVKSTLTNCTVEGNVFGAGYSASLPTVAVMNNSFQTEPYYDQNLGAYLEAVLPSTETYTWQHSDVVNSTATAIDKTKHILYTTADLTTLGAVTGKATLTINGTTTVAKSVYGGGEESGVGNGTEGDGTEVNITSGTIGTTGQGGAEYGNVFGGGKGKADDVTAGQVKGNTTINISGSPTILHNVYGGGAYGSVGDFTYDATTGMPTALATANTGTCNVTITGGTIGSNGKDNGMVFGSSRGDVATPVGTPAVDPNDRMAWVYSTNVTIGTQSETPSLTTPKIAGSVYGSGENGHTFQNTQLNIHSGTIGITDPEDEDGGAAYPYRGNVYGGGCGTDMYWIDADEDGEEDDNERHYNPTAGVVRGNATVTIDGGQVAHNVYGAGAMGSVGNETEAESSSTSGKTTVTITGKAKIGVDGNSNGNVYAAARGDLNVQEENYANVRETELEISGNADIKGSVFGGGEAGLVWEGVTVNMLGGSVVKDLYGGGALADTQIANNNEGNTPSTHVTTVNLKGGTIGGNTYGGGLGTSDTMDGSGTITAEGVKAMVYGDVTVDLNKEVADNAKGCIIGGNIFGCNNLNGTPKGEVTVHIHKTQNAVAETIANPTEGEKTAKVEGRYDIAAVYGGGNLAAYEPKNANAKANVIIDGCEVTSIRQVYGGGNAASTPATAVTINGTYEIEELFGGGNGQDDIVLNSITLPNPGANVGYKNYSEFYKEGDAWKVRDKADADTKEERTGSSYVYGSGRASVDLYGGTVHRVFGGSNTKGNVRQTAVTMLEDASGCPFDVEEAYGGGKSASMDAEAKLLMACIPGLDAVYGGAEEADIHDNVTLTITNGTFDRVFGGNNKSGMINGSITVNIEEVGCRPIIIGELYGGGNLAPYSIYGYNADGTPKTSGNNPSDDPEVNVKSFTSIGSIYGGGYGTGALMVGSPTVNINEVADPESEAQNKSYTEDDPESDDPEVVITKYYSDYAGETKSIDGHDVILPSHEKGKMGSINNVFGGGNAAKVMGNTTVNIGTAVGDDIYMAIPVNVGDALPADCYTKSGNEYTPASGEAVEGTTYYKKYTVLGVDIRGNIYGGGNAAEVTGDTNVVIGKKQE